MTDWQVRWSAMTQRERYAVLLAASVVGLALLWWVALEPALQGRKKLSERLPALRREAAQLAGLAQHYKNVPRATETDLAAYLNSSLAAAGFDANAAQNDANGRVVVRLAGADYGRLMNWLLEAQTQSHAQLQSANIKLAEPGRVNAEFVLAR